MRESKLSNKASGLVSVVIPTKDRRDMLWQAIKSVLNQTYKNLEIIVLDNNSKDGSQEYIQKRTRDTRLYWYRSKKDLTMQENWQRGFKYTRGKFFVRLDDDNLFFSDFIEKAVMEISKEKLDCVMFFPLITGNRYLTRVLFKPDQKLRVISQNQLIYLEYFNMTDSNYALYKTSLLKEVGKADKFYTTTLPDRYLNYLVSNLIKSKKVRVGLKNEIAALTRFDYKIDYMKTNLKYIDFTKIKTWRDIKKYDCHIDFNMHRFLSWSQYYRVNNKMELPDKMVTDKRLGVNLMRLGYIYSYKYDFLDWRQNIILLRYVMEIISDFLINFNGKMEGRGVFLNLASVLYNLYVRFRPGPREESDKLVQKTIEQILKRKIPKRVIKESPSLYGELGHLLETI